MSKPFGVVSGIIARAAEDHKLREQYRNELTQLMDHELAGTSAARAISEGEKKFSQFKKKHEKEELAAILDKYQGADPRTKPQKTGARYELRGWDDKEEGYSGKIRRAPEPLSVANSLHDPLQANERRVGNTTLINELANVWGQLLEERGKVDAKIDKARAFIAALEEEQGQEPQEIEWVRMDPFKCGVLPPTPRGLKYEGKYPPQSQAEQEALGKVLPDYAYWVALPERVKATKPDDRMAGFYTRRDILREEHEKIINQFKRKAGMQGVVREWINDDDIHNAAINAGEEIDGSDQ